MATIAEKLATHFAQLTFADLPESVVANAKMALLDLFGAALDGSQTEEATSLTRAMAHFDQGTGGSIWGCGTKRASYAMAALANGTFSHARELDDWGAGLHPGAVCIPAAIAAGEYVSTDGKTLLTAVFAGYEVMMRTAKAAGGDVQYRRGWHPTGTCGSFGAAAAVSKVIGLPPDEFAWALGLAGSFTGGTLAFLVDGAMSKRFHPGKAAETGLVAAFMAGEGFTGPRHIFEAEKGGFLSTYGGDGANPSLLTEDLDTRYRMLDSGLKPYASCRDVHAAVDAALALREDYRIDAGEIERVLVETTEEAVMLCAKNEVLTLLDAQMSIPHGVAVALAPDRGSLQKYTVQQLKDPLLIELAKKVETVATPDFDGAEHCAALTVELKDGKRLKRRVDVASGDPANPLSEEAVKNKFRMLAESTLQPNEMEALIEMVMHIEELENIHPLCDLLRAESSKE